MEKLKWIDHELKVKHGAEEVLLLPKEYQLLQHLWERPFQVFSREELLDAVWSLENPTDRTVDDHIYRLRKKLRPLASLLSIATVRGKGYLLKVDEQVHRSPLAQDQDVASSAKVLFHKYHLYGQGKALKVLEENQDIFGFELDVEHQCYLHFMKGDFEWFLKDERSFWDTCYYLMHIYSYIQPDKEKSLHYFTKALAEEKLPGAHRTEIRLLNRLSLLIFTKRLPEAETQLTASKKEIVDRGLQNLYPLTLLTELYLVFLQNDKPAIEKKMKEVGETLEKYPFSREQATFLIMQGIHCFLNHEEDKADRFFQEGFKLFKEAKYIPGLMISLNVILFFIHEFRSESDLFSTYKEMWQDLAFEYRFSELKSQIEYQLDVHLNRKNNTL
ncbi:winged helix-turn-helix domain-containing protein [Halobacillus trueperi]|uniref:Winged helix family transcriptional regulator n=1 Tax=Halobacillus trueperi TaxID=156205 RepID=A0A3E0JE57_9BACI|nr:winged helix-turn-helix domain-containing protein [Halobacillus trueperi]REJ11059.1 winged helix family transcriptional regulator [Halobacillus trueperi]